MFSFLRKETCPLQVYGKLPLAKDYLRIGCGNGPGMKMREWLDQAFSGAGMSQPPVFPWPMRFMIGDGWGAPIVGCAWPSSDAGGLRKFPFVAFVERRRKAVGEDVREGFEALNGLWIKLEHMFVAHRNHTDGKGLLSALRGQQVLVGVEEPEPLERVDWEAFTGALFGDEAGEGIQELFRELEALRAGSDRTPVRLPLVNDLPALPQVYGWWRVLEEMRFCSDDEVPTLFFPQHPVGDDEPSYLTWFPRAPQPREVAWLSSGLDAGARPPGDLISGVARRSDGAPASENASLLADSMRGALASFRARSGPR